MSTIAYSIAKLIIEQYVDGLTSVCVIMRCNRIQIHSACIIKVTEV